MTTIVPLPLPGCLPHPSAVGSAAHRYRPEHWEHEYRSRRYLSRVPQGELELRYEAMLRNVNVLVEKERDIIPITSTDSSWYWVQKEFQTRLKFSIPRWPPKIPRLWPL